MRYDVIVAGAGPAGSTVARECAAAGLSVMLLERASFPRDKPCGGGVSAHTAALLPFSIDSVTERIVDGMFVSVRRRPKFTRYSPQPMAFLTQRSQLDALLAVEAGKAGAHLRERLPVRAVERLGGRIVVGTDNGSFEGRVLVAADGANGPTARMAGIAVKRWVAVAIEGNVTPDGSFPDRYARTVGIDIGDTPGGYGWLFPKGDHLNIGVGGTRDVGPTLRPRLEALTRFYGFEPKSLWGTRGHPLPVRRPDSALMDGNVVLVGDAAGLIDPLTGEGIYYAVRSGQAAARAIRRLYAGDADDLTSYEAEMGDDVLPNLRAGLQVHAVFHLAPWIYAALVQRSERAWRAVWHIARGDTGYTGVKATSPALGFSIDLISDALRAAPRILGREVDWPSPERFFTDLRLPLAMRRALDPGVRETAAP